MIANFNDKSLESFYCQGIGKHIPSDIHSVIRRKLDQLNAAVDINDLRVPPGNRLELLSGNRQDLYSIRVNRQWRIVFKWVNNIAHDVKLEDYH